MCEFREGEESGLDQMTCNLVGQTHPGAAPAC